MSKEDRAEQKKIQELRQSLEEVERKFPGMEIFKRIDEMPGGDRDPFATALGPTEECLSAHQVVSFVKNGETDREILHHLKECKDCAGRMTAFKNIYRKR